MLFCRLSWAALFAATSLCLMCLQSTASPCQQATTAPLTMAGGKSPASAAVADVAAAVLERRKHPAHWARQAARLSASANEPMKWRPSSAKQRSCFSGVHTQSQRADCHKELTGLETPRSQKELIVTKS